MIHLIVAESNKILEALTDMGEASNIAFIGMPAVTIYILEKESEDTE